MKWFCDFWDNLVTGMCLLWDSFWDDGRVSTQQLLRVSSPENMSESMRQAHAALLQMANARIAIVPTPCYDDELLVSYPEMRY